MIIFPSHKKSTNERNERRANQKAETRDRLATTAELTDAIVEDFRKKAARAVAAGLVSRKEHVFRIQAGKSHYPVYRIGESFRCECNTQAKYGDCQHQHAARIFFEQNN